MGDVPNLRILDQFGNVEYYPITKPEETFPRLIDADVAITCKVIIDADLISKLPNLKLICAAATGLNHIDQTAANENGIVVRNVAGYSTNSVAQSTFSLILGLMSNVSYFDQYVKNGSYSQNDMFTHMGRNIVEINGKTIGVLGLGAIGKKVAEIGRAFGAFVCYYSTSGTNNDANFKRLELDELLKISDIVTVHAPLNNKTTNLITYDKIRLMKPTAILINAGRGGIVDELGLAKALDENMIAGAGTDVFSKEPVLPDNPLLHIKDKNKIIFSPHSAWTSLEARTILMEGIAKNIREFVEV
jgi:glycerate dehydrogenase